MSWLIEEDTSSPGTWKKYLVIAVKFLAIFAILTFSMGVLLIFSGKNWMVPGIIFGIFSIIAIICSMIKMIRSLPIEAILLAAPTLPLLMMIIVLSLFPIFEMINEWHK